MNTRKITVKNTKKNFEIIRKFAYHTRSPHWQWVLSEWLDSYEQEGETPTNAIGLSCFANQEQADELVDDIYEAGLSFYRTITESYNE